MFDDVTPRLGLPYVVAAQAQKHIPINESFARLDGLVQLAVESRAIAVQPASPVAGGVWILPASATGVAWVGQPAGTLMRFEAGAWEPLAPAEGVLAWVKDENQMVAFDGAAWTPLSSTFRSLTAAASPNLPTTCLLRNGYHHRRRGPATTAPKPNIRSVRTFSHSKWGSGSAEDCGSLARFARARSTRNL